ncbi:MAG TPA: Gfo/Idh/MocA family oxidoreductase [Dongiaceae bacterium]
MRRRLAILGLGMAVAPHAKSLVDLSDRTEIIWACSRSVERCRNFARSFPFPTTTDVDRVLGDERVEALLLLTPPSTHVELAGRALAAGKHLLIEKPVALTARDADGLVGLALRHRRRLGVVLQFRFREASRRLAELIATGALGPLVTGDCRVQWWRAQSYYDEPGRGSFARDGGGVLLTQAIHTLDLFRSFVGRIEVIAGLAATTALHRMESEDYAAALLRLGDGAPGCFVASTASFPGSPERIELVFANATARLEGMALEIHHQDGRRDSFGAARPSGSGADPMQFAHDAHRALIVDFLDALDEEREPRANGAEGAATQHLIETILASARK